MLPQPDLFHATRPSGATRNARPAPHTRSGWPIVPFTGESANAKPAATAATARIFTFIQYSFSLEPDEVYHISRAAAMFARARHILRLQNTPLV